MLLWISGSLTVIVFTSLEFICVVGLMEAWVCCKWSVHIAKPRNNSLFLSAQCWQEWQLLQVPLEKAESAVHTSLIASHLHYLHLDTVWRVEKCPVTVSAQRRIDSMCLLTAILHQPLTFPRDHFLEAAFLKMYSSTPRHIAFLLRDLGVSPPSRKFALWCRQQTQTFTSLLQTSKRPSEKTEDAKMWNGNGNGAERGG